MKGSHTIISYKTRLFHRALIMGMRLALELTREVENPFMGKVHFVSTSEQAEALLAQLRAQHR